MSMRLNRCGYEKLIDEDRDWLETMPRTLERDHILAILDRAVAYEYGSGAEGPVPKGSVKIRASFCYRTSGYHAALGDYLVETDFPLKVGEDLTIPTAAEDVRFRCESVAHVIEDGRISHYLCACANERPLSGEGIITQRTTQLFDLLRNALPAWLQPVQEV